MMIPATETPQDAWPRLRALTGADTTVLLATTAYIQYIHQGWKKNLGFLEKVFRF